VQKNAEVRWTQTFSSNSKASEAKYNILHILQVGNAKLKSHRQANGHQLHSFNQLVGDRKSGKISTIPINMHEKKFPTRFDGQISSLQ